MSDEDQGRDATPLASQLSANWQRFRELESMRLSKTERARVVAVANQKGGVGKTTSAVNVAAALALGGLKTLVIDCDPQGNATTALGISRSDVQNSIYEVLIGQSTLESAVLPCPDIEGLFVCPSHINLAGAEVELVGLNSREMALSRALEAYLSQTDFDFVILDCPPSLGIITLNAMVACREVLIPIQCEYYALEGLSQLLNNISLIRDAYNPNLAISAILLTMFDRRTNLSNEVAAELRTHFPTVTLNTVIPRSVRISEAPSYGQTVLTYDPRSTGAIAYREVAIELAGAENG